MPRPPTTCSSVAPADCTANISHPPPDHDMHAAGPGMCVVIFAPELPAKRRVRRRISRGHPRASPSIGRESFAWHARCCGASRPIPLWAAAGCPPPLSLGAFLRFIGSRLGLIASSSLFSCFDFVFFFRLAHLRFLSSFPVLAPSSPCARLPSRRPRACVLFPRDLALRSRSTDRHQGSLDNPCGAAYTAGPLFGRLHFRYASIAQLDRASAYEAGGRKFESSWTRQASLTIAGNTPPQGAGKRQPQ